jgi:hypothetical protein
MNYIRYAQKWSGGQAVPISASYFSIRLRSKLCCCSRESALSLGLRNPRYYWQI